MAKRNADMCAKSHFLLELSNDGGNPLSAHCLPSPAWDMLLYHHIKSQTPDHLVFGNTNLFQCDVGSLGEMTDGIYISLRPSECRSSNLIFVSTSDSFFIERSLLFYF
jgi:hypothetical protein